MIAGLTGTIRRFGPARVYLDVQGVEYEVHVPLSVQSLLQMRGPGAEASLRIYHHMTEGDQRLFGFHEVAQREFFIALLGIKGLGSALALSLMSHLEPAQFLDLCARKDAKTLCRIPRVGKTTAETLIFEVNRRKDKWTKLLQAPAGDPAAAPAGAAPEPLAELALLEEELAIQALLQLGYKESEALGAVEKLRQRADQAAEDCAGWSAADWIAKALRIL